jgi:hypothetical protein
MTKKSWFANVKSVIARNPRDEAIQFFFRCRFWIASLALAMTWRV